MAQGGKLPHSFGEPLPAPLAEPAVGAAKPTPFDIPEKPANGDGALEMSTFEAPGILVDQFGHRWTIPAEGLQGFAGIEEISPFVLGRRDPNMCYETRGIREADQFRREGWVTVRRSEVGAPDAAPAERDYGKSLTGEDYVVGDTVLVKMPALLSMRRRAETDKLAKRQRRAVENDPAQLAAQKAKRAGRPVHLDVQHGFTTDPSPSEPEETAGAV